MRRFRTGWAVAVAALAAALAGAAPAEAQTGPRQVFRRAELEAAGVRRLSELLPWVAGWSGSADGIAWSPSPDGLPSAALPAAVPEWVVLVDGQRVEATSQGALYPELVPVLMEQVDSVVVTRAPTLAGGGFAPRGVLHLHTRPAPRGGLLLIGYRNGSETGDPGPYLWTPRATENVDRWGPDARVMQGYGGARWDVRVGGRYLRHPVTDPRLQERYGTLGQQFTYVRAPVAQLGVRALGGRHQLIAGWTEQFGYAFVPLRQRMERANHQLTHTGATGSVSWAPGSSLAYRVVGSTEERVRWPDPLPAGGDADRRTLHGSLELRRQGERWEGRLGAGADRRTLRLPDTPSERRTERTMFAEVEHRPGPRFAHGYAGALVGTAGGTGARASASLRWSPDSLRSLTAILAGARVAPGEGTAWMEARAAGAPDPLPPRSLLWSEVAWSQPLFAGAALEAGAIYGRLAEAGADGGVEGARAGVRLGLALAAPRLHARLRYEALAALDGSAAHREAMRSLPTHVLHASLRYTPVPSLRLGGRLLHRSGADWRGVALPAADAEPLLPAASRLDLSVEKWLWSRRLRARLEMQNALARPDRHHPFGADFGQRYFVDLTATLAPPEAR